MPGYQSNYLVICSPTITRWEKTKELCPTCEELTDFLVYWQEWYGWTKICLACGERWQSGERLERPFERGWRDESVQHATKLLNRLEKERNETTKNKKQS